MRAQETAWLVVLVLLVGGAGVASAQTQLGGVNIEGQIEAGGRFYAERPSPTHRAKFEEYRDLPAGLFLQSFDLRLSRPDESYSAELSGSKWGQRDQDYFLSVGRLGQWQLDFLWDQTPHLISTTGRLLAVETHRGVFELPGPRPALSLHNAAPRIDEIGVRWDKAQMRFGYSVTPDFDLTAQYTRTRKEGDKPMGMAFGSPGSNFYEVLQPIEQTVHDFRLTGAYAQERYQLQVAYLFSAFENDLTRIIASNPCSGLGAPCTAGPDTGQSSLPPSNWAHSISLAGGVNLPMRTRINANAAWGLHLQNDTFLPHTTNSAFAGNPDLVLPKQSLDGNVQTWLLYLNATSRPFDRVTFGAKYRFYDYDDHSRTITFPGVVVNDNAASPSRSAGRWSYQKQNADLDARTQLLESVALTTGVGWERWDRNFHREVPISDEFFAKAALDSTPTEWLLARLTYTPSFRRISSYHSGAHAEHSVVEDAGAALAGQSTLLRKFDESDRDRQKVEGQLQLALADFFTATPTAAYHHDDYVASPLGLQQEMGWSAGIDLSWAPLERVVFSSGYVCEQNFQKMRSRARTPTDDSSVNDWLSDLQDTVQTVYAGVKASLIPKVLELKINGNYSNALGTIETRNTSGVTPTIASARAQRLPAFEDTVVRLETSLRYYFLKGWAANLGYIFESFEKTDWRTDTLNPFIPGVSSIWLGNDLKNYTAHYFGVTLAYSFK